MARDRNKNQSPATPVAGDSTSAAPVADPPSASFTLEGGYHGALDGAEHGDPDATFTP